MLHSISSAGLPWELGRVNMTEALAARRIGRAGSGQISVIFGREEYRTAWPLWRGV